MKETFEKVNKARFEVPSFVSFAGRNLIQSIIVKDPKRRLSLDQILAHPFIRGRQAEPLTGPINTNRLKVIKQRIRHGVIEIDNYGGVAFEHQNDRTKVFVSKGGINVSVQYSDGVIEKYIYPDLEAPLMKRYELMRRFVNLVQSKTPKVILYTKAFKAYLMESHDFVMYYENADKAEYMFRDRIMRIQNKDDTVELLEPTVESIDQLTNSNVRMYVLDCLTRFNQLSQVSIDLENNPASAFPFVIKENGRTTIHHKDFKQQIKEEKFKRKYISGIGWCIALGKEHFLMLLDDASSLELQGQENWIKYQNHDCSPVEKYSLEESLPQHVRLKLIHFPRFMDLWKERTSGGESRGINPRLGNIRSTLTFGSSFPEEDKECSC